MKESDTATKVGILTNKMITILLVISLLLGCFPMTTFAATVVDSGTCGDNLTWELTDDGTLTISGEGEMYDYTGWSNRSPWDEDEICEIIFVGNVSTIGNHAFSYCDNLTEIKIPDGVTSIGDSSFSGCDNLTSIDISDSVLEIGEWAFSDCYSLTTISFGNKAVCVGEEAFSNCENIQSIYITDLKAWCESDFHGYNSNPLEWGVDLYLNGESLDSLGSIVIPDGTTKIANGAFCCTGIKSVTIPDSVTSIGDSAFSSCDSLDSIDIPNSVISIGNYAFYNCDSLNSVTIPSSVTAIGYCAFQYCDLTSVSVLGSVISAGSNIFDGCFELTSFYITDLASFSTTGYGAGGASGGKKLYLNGELVKKLEIPKGVTEIASSAFYHFDCIEEVAIPDGVTIINPSAFARCDGLTSVSIPDSVAIIEAGAFGGCDALTSISIPYGVTSIYAWAFSDCSSLSKVTIPASVTTFGPEVFADCSSLTTVVFCGSAPKYSYITSLGSVCDAYYGDAFYNVTATAYYPSNDDTWTEEVMESYGDNITWVAYGKGETPWESDTTESEPTEPAPTEPETTEPVPTEPEPTEPAPTEPKPTEPKPTEPDERTFDIQYDVSASNVDGMGKWEATYKDSFFETSAKGSYNHDLAILSLGMAMSAVTVGKANEGDEKYIKEFLLNIGCEEASIYHEKFDNNTSTDDTCAFAYGLTHLEASDTYLIPVAIRGFGYGADFGGEWISNFHVVEKGYDAYAAGFKKAADHVYESLIVYVDDLVDSGIPKSKIKIWVSGFSRAAAISNLLGARLNEDSGINNANIFVYTFATPATVKTSSAQNYNNIFNIVSEVDIVPRVPLSSWGYTRYGITYYLPCHSNSGTAYKGYIDKVSEEFKELMAESKISTVLYSQEKRQELAIDLLIDYLDDVIKTSKQYANTGYQQLFMDILSDSDGSIEKVIELLLKDHEFAAETLIFFLNNQEELSKEEKASFITVLIGELSAIILLEDDNQPIKGILRMILELLVRYDARVIANTVSDKDQTIVYDTLIGLIFNTVDQTMDSTLLKQHWPEAYLAWLRCGTSVLKAGAYKKVSVKCPVDVVVYDASGEVVGRVTDDIVDETIEESVCIVVNEYGEKDIYLDEEGEYSIEIIAREAGELDIVISAFDGDNVCTSTDCYIDLLMAEGQVFGVETNDDVVSTEDAILEPDVSTEDGTQTVEITLTSNLPGIMFGQGTHLLGESVDLIASACSEYGFDGWYLNGELLSKDCSYTFSAVEDLEIEARFHEHSWEESHISVEAPCTEMAEMTYACSLCAATKTGEVPGSHSYEAVITEPTCTEKGYTTFTCSVCDDSYTDVYTDATDHSDNNNDGQCDDCNAECGVPTQPTEETQPTQQTEDKKHTFIWILIPVVLLAGTAVFLLIWKKKKSGHRKEETVEGIENIESDAVDHSDGSDNGEEESNDAVLMDEPSCEHTADGNPEGEPSDAPPMTKPFYIK